MGIPAAIFIFFGMLRPTRYGYTAKLNTKGPKCALLLRLVLDDQGAGEARSFAGLLAAPPLASSDVLPELGSRFYAFK
jgi:hypothetical protein